MTAPVFSVAGAVNFRDLGGHRTPSGPVRSGRVFRSASLAYLDPEEAAQLAREAGIEVVLDLRSDQEVEERPLTTVEQAGVDRPPDPGSRRSARRRRVLRMAGPHVGRVVPAHARAVRGRLRRRDPHRRGLVASPARLPVRGGQGPHGRARRTRARDARRRRGIDRVRLHEDRGGDRRDPPAATRPSAGTGRFPSGFSPSTRRRCGRCSQASATSTAPCPATSTRTGSSPGPQKRCVPRSSREADDARCRRRRGSRSRTASGSASRRTGPGTAPRRTRRSRPRCAPTSAWPRMPSPRWPMRSGIL